MNISANQIDALKELVNIGIGRAAGVLNQMVSAHIKLQVPRIQIITLRDLTEEIKDIDVDLLAHTRLLVEQLQIKRDIIIFFEMDSFDMLLSAIENTASEYVAT